MSTGESVRSDARSVAAEAKDVLIAQLRREVRDLSEAQDQANEMRAKLDSLTHLHNLLAEEKRRAETEADDRHSKLARTVAGLRAEIETLSMKNSELELQTDNLRRQNDWFEEVVKADSGSLSKE
jgi:predicted nuclease with TOPRIM domain